MPKRFMFGSQTRFARCHTHDIMRCLLVTRRSSRYKHMCDMWHRRNSQNVACSNSSTAETNDLSGCLPGVTLPNSRPENQKNDARRLSITHHYYFIALDHTRATWNNAKWKGEFGRAAGGVELEMSVHSWLLLPRNIPGRTKNRPPERHSRTLDLIWAAVAPDVETDRSKYTWNTHKVHFHILHLYGDGEAFRPIDKENQLWTPV